MLLVVHTLIAEDFHVICHTYVYYCVIIALFSQRMIYLSDSIVYKCSREILGIGPVSIPKLDILCDD